MRILPLIAFGYGAAYIDRVNISYAALQMNRDLHFTATTYGFGAGLFFLSYAACEIPSNLLLCRFGARRWLARIMVSWGLVAMSMVFVRTPMQFYIARFFLGMAEAGFFPGVIFYLTQWFPSELRARSVTRFYIAWPLSSVVMGVLAGGLMGLDGHLGLTGWQWLFAVEGVPAVILGVIFFLLLPDGPATARWLTEAERNAIVSRLSDRVGAAPAHHAIGPVLKDRRVALLGLFNLCMLGSSYAYSFFAPSIVQRLSGFSITGTGFVIAAVHLLIILFILLGVPLIYVVAALHWTCVRSLRWRILHLGAILFVAAESLLGMPCPLTVWEDQLRGQRAAGGFIERWIDGIILLRRSCLGVH